MGGARSQYDRCARVHEDCASSTRIAVVALPRVASTTTVRLGAVILGAAVLAACSSAPSPAPEPPAPDPSVEALAVYADFFRVSQDANAAPTARDWTAELRQLARGQALDAAVLDVQNYASLSARVDGRLGQAPAVDPAVPATNDKVSVLDCLDATGVRVLTADGRQLGDQANQSPRYRYRAEVVRDGDRWWVERAIPAPEEPC